MKDLKRSYAAKRAWVTIRTRKAAAERAAKSVSGPLLVKGWSPVCQFPPFRAAVGLDMGSFEISGEAGTPGSR
jgi:hypothetical protein